LVCSVLCITLGSHSGPYFGPQYSSHVSVPYSMRPCNSLTLNTYLCNNKLYRKVYLPYALLTA
jgi:hypothetical protein